MTGSADDSTLRALHRLVEHYTPDGALGRTLLGGTVLLFAPLLFLGSIALAGAGTLAALALALFGFAVSVPAFLIGALTLWPVYLSLIGNVESAAAYPDGAADSAEDRETAEDILKRRYAAGELSQEEFERRLESVLATSGRGDGSRRGDRSRSNEDRQRRGRGRERDPQPERSRNR